MINFELMLNSLESTGYFIQDDLMNPVELKAISSYCESLPSKSATISQSKIQNTEIRGDSIAWLDNDDKELSSYVTIINQIKQSLNSNFFFGINDFEYHYAKYPVGSFYKKHLDCFQNSNTRKVTFILYLNENWKKEDQGQLLIHNANPFKVDPIFNRLVVFISNQLEHEVLPTFSERKSITGWLK